ncbi:MAG TPA: hypothetical protein VFW33_20365, partial [Gemmataceae bacterium]|nr:hypothetical protein [Gemmataceae bacterium]
WLLLGMAYYRLDQCGAAVEALQEAFRRAEGLTYWRPGKAFFFLAMAQWRCGRREEAAQTYQQGIGRVENAFHSRDYLNRTVQAEAAALLRI